MKSNYQNKISSPFNPNPIFLSKTDIHGHLIELTKKFIILLFLCCFSLFNNQLEAQEPHKSGAKGSNPIVPIDPGQTLPESMWEVPLKVTRHPKGKEQVSLNDFRDKKLIILDFWATWCSPCVAMIPKNEALKKKYEKDLEIIMITDQAEDIVKPFLGRVEQQDKLQHIWTIYGKHDFHQIFKYRTMPHAAIIYDGVYKGAVYGNEITEEKIEMMLNDKWDQIVFKKPELTPKNKYDKDEFLYIDGNGGGREFITYRSVLGGYNPSLGNGSGYVANTEGGGKRMAFLNFSLANIFQYAYSEARIEFNPMNRKLLEVKDRLKLTTSAAGDEALAWMQSGNVYCYELVVPKPLKNKFFEIMRDDLTRIFPQYQASIEYRDVECYVLKVTDRSKLEKHRSLSGTMEVKQDVYGLSMKHAPLDQMVARFSVLFMQNSPYPIINGSEYNEPINMELHTNVTNMEETNKALAKYGLHFFKELKNIEMLVIKDNQDETDQ